MPCSIRGFGIDEMTEQRVTISAPAALSQALDDHERPQRGRVQRFVTRLIRRPSALVSAVLLLLVVVAAILAPLLAPDDPNAISSNLRKPPTHTHLFGTDDLGRDVLSRVIFGARVSLRVGIIAIGIALVAGTLLGLTAGYWGSWADSIIMRIMDIMLAFPGFLLAIAIVAILGPGLYNVMIAVGIEAIPVYARTSRSSVLSMKEEEYVVGARAMGAGHGRILFRYILPNILAPLIVLATLGVGIAILSAAGLSYLGLGAQPPTAEWGAMLSSARSFVRNSWWMSTFPGLAIMIVVLALNLFGDGLREILDPRVRD
jgi:peptide/nickel transport system permease protein